MASPSTEILQEYAAHIKRICPSLPEVETIVHQLRSPSTGFGAHRITFPVFCTNGGASDAPKLCKIFEELHLWNEMLSHVRLELREATPGRLAVARINGLRPGNFNPPAAQRAVICLHWLLTVHYCVFSLEPDSLVLEIQPELFCDAIQHSISVRVVRIHGQENFISITPKVFEAIFGADKLEELHLDFVHIKTNEITLQPIVLAYIKHAPFLRTLILTRFWPMVKTTTIIEALEANSTISTLKIHLVDANTRAFGAFLANNHTITDLALVGKQDAGLLTPVFQALERNRALRKLSLQQFVLDVVDSTHLADMLTVNTTIQELSFSSCTWNNFPAGWLYGSSDMEVQLQAAKSRWESWWQVDTFAHGIRNSASLQRLRFDNNHFQNEEMLRLLRAVHEASQFRELCFENISCQSIAKIADAVRQTGTIGKFLVLECRSSCCYFADSISKVSSFPSTTVCTFYDLMPPQLAHICGTLANSDQVSAFDLHIKDLDANIDEDCAALVLAYLATTTALKCLRLRLKATREAWSTIIHGLCQNKSLEEFSLEDAFLDDSTVLGICSWVQKSRTLHHFICKCGFYCQCKALVQQLAQSLEDNHTLTFLLIDCNTVNDYKWQVINQVLSRNNSLVTRAAEFALGSTLKLCAAAYELVFWHPLVRKRVEAVYSVNEVEAREKVQDGVRRLQTDFWKLSGVVNEELSCYPSNVRRTQIDGLGFDAWVEIRKFLSVSDVSSS